MNTVPAPVIKVKAPFTVNAQLYGYLQMTAKGNVMFHCCS